MTKGWLCWKFTVGTIVTKDPNIYNYCGGNFLHSIWLHFGKEAAV